MSLNLPDKPRPLPPPLPQPEPPAEAKPLPKPQPKAVRKPPTVITTNKPTPDRVELPPAKPVEPPPLPPTPSPRPDAPTDMMSYVNAARERRRQSEDYAARINAEAVARERKPSEDEVRNEIIKSNLKAGTNGIFRIISVGPYNAQFSFMGWTTDYSNARRELVLVEAGPGEDIRRNIARKMIELIRRHYSGDFNWESLRLGRVVVLSARQEDGPGLEDFLILEFFQGDALR
ncbi:MAG TPA: hypothetical protein PLH03_01385 [Methylophilaceae bacterium]|nr:hypothetical protein [Methylophilaceae bacterium]